MYFLQFLEDISDRQLAKHLQDSNAAKLICRFNLNEKTHVIIYLQKIGKK